MSFLVGPVDISGPVLVHGNSDMHMSTEDSSKPAYDYYLEAKSNISCGNIRTAGNTTKGILLSGW